MNQLVPAEAALEQLVAQREMNPATKGTYLLGVGGAIGYCTKALGEVTMNMAGSETLPWPLKFAGVAAAGYVTFMGGIFTFGTVTTGIGNLRQSLRKPGNAIYYRTDFTKRPSWLERAKALEIRPAEYLCDIPTGTSPARKQAAFMNGVYVGNIQKQEGDKGSDLTLHVGHVCLSARGAEQLPLGATDIGQNKWVCIARDQGTDKLTVYAWGPAVTKNSSDSRASH